MATLNVTIDPTGAVAGGAVVENTIRDIRDETRTLATAVKRNVDTAFQRATRRSGRNLRGLGSEVKRVTSSVSRLTGILGIGGGASLGFAFVRGLQGAEKFSVAVSELSAITGAVGEDLEFLSDSAREMGATTIFSATQAAQGYQLIASAKPELLGNAEALEEVTRHTLTLAAAAGTTLPQAADIAATSLNQFGAGADQAARFINVLAAGSKFGASLVTETAAALKNAGVSARSAGIDFEEANAAIQVFARDGIKGGEAGTALRNIILKLEQQAEQFRPSVQGLSGAIRNLGQENLTTTELTRLFGLENVNAAQAILRNIGLLESMTDTLTGTNIATEQAATRFDNLTGDLRLLGSAIQENFIRQYEDAEPATRTFIQLLTELVQSGNEASSVFGATPNLNELIFGTEPATEADRLRENLRDVRNELEDARLAASIFRDTLLADSGVTSSIDNVAERGNTLIAQMSFSVKAATTAHIDYASALKNTSLEIFELEEQEQLALAALLAHTAANQDNTDSIALNAGARLELIRRTQELRRENELLAEQEAADTRDAEDPLSEYRLPRQQLLRRTRRLRESLRTPEEELEFQRLLADHLRNNDALSDELHARFIARAEERYAAETRGTDTLERQGDAYGQLLASLDPLIAAQQQYQESNSLLDEIEKNRATLGIDLAEILEARVLVENRLAEAIEGVTDATSAQEQAQRQVISRYLPLRRAQQQYEQALKLIEAAQLGATETTIANANALREYERAVESAGNASRDYADSTRRGFDDVQSNVEEFTNNFSSAITDALTGGEASFSNFFDSIERMIVERFSQQFIAEPLNQLINNLIGGSGGGGGGFFGGILSSIFGGGSSGPSYEELYPTDILGFRQYGGVARPGRTYLVGEAGPEILRQGVTGGYVTPIRGQQSGGVQPAEVRVEVNNYNSDQSNVEIAERTGPDGEQVIEVAVLNAVDRSIASGALDSRLGLYGARRETIPRG